MRVNGDEEASSQKLQFVGSSSPKPESRHGQRHRPWGEEENVEVGSELDAQSFATTAMVDESGGG